MASIEELYKKTEFAKLPLKKDRTPITARDFDSSELQVSEEQLEKARGGKLGNLAGGFTPTKKYSDITDRK
jgi:hypothetical protein